MNIKLTFRKFVPTWFYLIKLGLLAILTHFLILPFLFETFTFFGELRSVWQSVITVIIAAYLADIIQIKFGGKDWF